MITLGLLKTEFTSLLVNQTISTRIADWAHWTVADILSSYDFWWNKKKGSFSTTSGTAEYFLNHRVQGKQISWMGDESNQGREIVEVPLEHIYKYDSTPTDTGDPEVWAYVEQAEVQASNASGTSTAVSSSASDSGITVVIWGQVSSVDRYETISLNGTTTATPSSALTWTADSVRSVSLSQACVGVVTVTVGGTTVATIPPGLQRVQCPRIRLWRVPGSTLALPYIFYQKPMKAINDGDIIDIPDMGFEALRLGIEYIGHKNNGDIDFARAVKQEYKEAKAELFSRSNRELNQIKKKNFNQSPPGVPFILPRTISGSVS